MNLFKVLHDQVKKSLLQETKLSEDERRLFQWQFLSKIGNYYQVLFRVSWSKVVDWLSHFWWCDSGPLMQHSIS